MKFFFGIIFVTATVLVQESEQALYRRIIPGFMQKPSLSVYNYHRNFGIEEASRIMAAEAGKIEIPDLSTFHPKSHNGIDLDSKDEDVEMKIVGGVQAPLGSLPYQAGLDITMNDGARSVCGASLISKNRLVTAAHCWFDGEGQASHFTVVLGTTKLYRGGMRIDTDQVETHEQWNPRRISYDIAIIGIPDIEFTDNIQPVPLPIGYEDETFEGATVLASGFGKTDDSREIGHNQVLSYVKLNVIDNNRCQSVFADAVRRSNICVSGRGGRNICGGDSGGPMVVKIKDRLTLIGITSFGSADSCSNGYPGVFTRVTSFLDWIQNYL